MASVQGILMHKRVSKLLHNGILYACYKGNINIAMDKPVLPATLREMFDATTLRLASDNAVIMNGDEPEDYTTTLYNAEEVLLAMRTYFQD